MLDDYNDLYYMDRQMDKYQPFSNQNTKKRAHSSIFKVQDFKSKQKKVLRGFLQQLSCKQDGWKEVHKQNKTTTMSSKPGSKPTVSIERADMSYKQKRALQVFQIFKEKDPSLDVSVIQKLPKISCQQLDPNSVFKISQSNSQSNLKDYVMQTRSFTLQGRIKSIDRLDQLRQVYDQSDRLDETKRKPMLPIANYLKSPTEYIQPILERVPTQKVSKPIKSMKKILSVQSEDIVFESDKEQKPKQDQQQLYKVLMKRNYLIQQTINQWNKAT